MEAVGLKGCDPTGHHSDRAAAPVCVASIVPLTVRSSCMAPTRPAACLFRIVEMDRKSKEVRVRNPAAAGEPPRVFTMDNVFDESLSQQTVYEETCRPIVANIIQGYNGTIFCYGYERKKREEGDRKWIEHSATAAD